MKQSKVTQELNVKTSLLYARLLNRLSDRIVEDLKKEADIDILAGAMRPDPTQKTKQITKILQFSGIVEDPEAVQDKVRKLFKEKILTVQQLKQYLSE